MKKSYLSIVLALALVLSLAPAVFAEEGPSIRLFDEDEVRDRIRLQREELDAQRKAIRAELDARREEARLEFERRGGLELMRQSDDDDNDEDDDDSRIEERREENRLSRVERQQDIAFKQLERASRVMEATIERLEKIAERIESRMEKLVEAGGDVSESQTYMDSARLHLAEAVEALENFASTDISSESFQDSLVALRAGAGEVRLHARAAHAELVQAVRLLGRVQAEINSSNSGSDDNDGDNE